MTNAPYQPPAGWYPDPAGSAGERYWDGTAWSQATRDAVPAGPVQGATAATTYAEPVDPQLATFPRRLAGFLIDWIVIYIALTIVLAVTGINQQMTGQVEQWLDSILMWAEGNGQTALPTPGHELWSTLMLATVINIAIYALYRTVLLGTLSATLGQLALGLRTVRAGQPATARLGWGAAALRGIVGAVLYQHLMIGFVNGIFAAFTKKRQTLSDMLSTTQVLRIR